MKYCAKPNVSCNEKSNYHFNLENKELFRQVKK